MPFDPLESRVARLEDLFERLSRHLLEKSERELARALAERELADTKADMVRNRFKLLDDILIRIENLEEANPLPGDDDPLLPPNHGSI